MRAMVLEKSGTPLRLMEIPRPKPEPGEVLIRVRACGVCRTDLHVVDGELQNPKLPLVPGHEIVGTVVETGTGAYWFNVGARVGVPWLGWTCGECGFCAFWINRWHHATGESVDYLPSQDLRIAQHFPEIPREAFDSSVQLIDPDGSVYSGAEAVFRLCARNSRFRWLLKLYHVLPPFTLLTEWSYRFVARHRPFFSRVTKLFSGKKSISR